MVFNAAMNSIPVLLLAIGVDYGLHVVLRIREELKNSEEGKSAKRSGLFHSGEKTSDSKRNNIHLDSFTNSDFY